MKKDDFYSLKIGQEIYYEGKKLRIHSKIESLISPTNEVKLEVNLLTPDRVNSPGLMKWNKIHDDCSLEAPKVKNRFWQWSIKDPSGSYYRADNYMDNEGFKTNGNPGTNAWSTLDKIKIENDFIDV